VVKSGPSCRNSLPATSKWALLGLRMELNQINEVINRDKPGDRCSRMQGHSAEPEDRDRPSSSNNHRGHRDQPDHGRQERAAHQVEPAIQEGKSNLAGLKQTFTERLPDIKTMQARLAAPRERARRPGEAGNRTAAAAPDHSHAAEGGQSANAEEACKTSRLKSQATQVRIQATTNGY